MQMLGPYARFNSTDDVPTHGQAIKGPNKSTEPSGHGLIGVYDLAAGRKPHPLVLLHVGYGALQISDAQRLTGDHGMQRHPHHARVLAAIGVEDVELVDHRAQVLLAGIAFADIERDVVDLVAVGDRKYLSRLHFHRVWLIVVVPVAAIDHSLLGEDVERVVGLDQSGAEPAARPLAGRLLDRLQDAADGVALLFGIEAGEVRRVGGAVAHKLPAALLHFLDRLGMDFADLRVQGDGGFDAGVVEYVGHAPQPDAHPVFPPGVVENVGHVVRGIGRNADADG